MIKFPRLERAQPIELTHGLGGISGLRGPEAAGGDVGDADQQRARLGRASDARRAGRPA